MLYIIDKEYCDFCVWSPISDPVIIRIPRDPSWKVCLEKLIGFYFKQFLPKIAGSETADKRDLYLTYRDIVKSIDQVLNDYSRKRTERKAGKLKEEEETLCSLDLSELPTLSPSYIAQLAGTTATPLGAPESKAWWALREHRLTSSSFHKVLSAVRREKYPESLFKSVMDEYFMTNTTISRSVFSATINALEAYQQEQGVSLVPSGIWLDGSGILGASIKALHPDGETMVDVRCLVRGGDLETLLAKGSQSHLYREEGGEVTVRSGHRVWDKIQGSMHLSGREACDVVTFSDGAIINITRVHRDEAWSHNLEILREFYVERLFPRLCTKWARSQPGRAGPDENGSQGVTVALNQSITWTGGGIDKEG